MFMTITDSKPDPGLDFVLDAADEAIVTQAREALARKKYADAMKDAQFGPGAIANDIA